MTHPVATPRFHRASDPSDARIVTVGGEGDVVRIPLVMQKGGTISGTIGGPGYQDGDFLIYVTQADDPSGWSHRSVLAGHRSFTVEGLPEGTWKLGACVRGTNDSDSPTPAPGTVWYPSTTDWRSAHAVTIRGSEDVTRIDIYLPATRR